MNSLPNDRDHKSRSSTVSDYLTMIRTFFGSEGFREVVAEFLGVMILVLFGNGATCQTRLSANSSVSSTSYGDALSINFGFAVGLGLGGLVAGLGTSEGHINPAVTIAMATFGQQKFSWRKVPGYILGQVLGGLCGAGIVYANYIHAIDLVEGGRHIRTVPGTASFFGTYALPYMTSVSAWFEEFLGTALLLIAVCAMSDVKKRSNYNSSTVFTPLVLFITMLGISSAFGMQTGFAINPARDLGPRLLTAMVGYGTPVFTFRKHYWLWCPIIAPIAGALVSTFLYGCLFPADEKPAQDAETATASPQSGGAGENSAPRTQDPVTDRTIVVTAKCDELTPSPTNSAFSASGSRSTS